MKPETFETMCASLVLNKLKSIRLRQFTALQFEILIDQHIVSGRLQNLTISGVVSTEQEQLLINSFVIFSFCQDKTKVFILKNFITQHRIYIDQRYDMRVGSKSQYAYLHGYNANEVQANPVTIKEINEFRRNINQSLLKAVRAFNTLEVEIALACNANPNYALHPACSYQDNEIFDLLINSDLFATKNFNVCKMITDYDNELLLNYYFSHIGYAPESVSSEPKLFRKVHSYATKFNALKIRSFLQKYAHYDSGLQHKFIRSIQFNNNEIFLECIQNGVDINGNLAGHYPLTMICILGRLDMLMHILSLDIEIMLFDFQNKELGYNDSLDLLLQVTLYDRSDLLIPLLNIIDTDSYLTSSHLRLGQIRSLAVELYKPKIISIVDKIIQQQEEIVEELFLAAVQGDNQKIDTQLSLGININNEYQCRYLAHLLCEYDNHQYLQHALNMKGLDPNVRDVLGQYPLTICCRRSNVNTLGILLNLEYIWLFDFLEEDDEYYEPVLDPIRIAIEMGDLALLEYLLIHAKQYDRLIDVTLFGLRRIREFALQLEKNNVVAKIDEYIQILREGELFSSNVDGLLRDAADHTQSITRTDLSAIASINSLCNHFQIAIADSRHGTKVLTSSDYNFRAIFDSLAPYIENHINTTYKTYRYNSSEGILVPNKQFRKWAKEMFLSIKNGSKGYLGSYDTWRTSWFVSNTDEIKSGTGISVLEVWALAILAARDKMPFDDMILDNQSIDDRMHVLVDALVDSRRAYNLNNKYYRDDGESSNPSCVHGLPLRALLFLSKFHKCINIKTSPIKWAGSVAQEALSEFFTENSERRIELSRIMRLDHIQRSAMDNQLFKQFYTEATSRVRSVLLDKLGLIRDNGYLLLRELNEVLDTLETLSLPFAVDVRERSTSANFQYEDFSRVALESIKIEAGVELEQRKLPDTSDAFYAAILISAIDMGLDTSKAPTVEVLRAYVAHILREVLIHGKEVPEFANRVAVLSIQNSFRTVYGDCDDAAKQRFIKGIEVAALSNGFVTPIIAGIFNCEIRFFSLTGVSMYSITAHSLNIPQNTLLPAVYVAMHFSEDTYRPKPNHNFVNALVRSEKWPLLSSLAKKIAHKSIQEQLFLDAKVNTYFEVMQSRSISGLDQVLIPGDGDCLFTSSLLGAKNLGVVHTLDIPNAHALRLLLQQSLERKLLQARIQGLDSNGSNEIIDNFVAALLEHNELNSTSYTSYEQYIAAIGNPGVWAGHFELHLLPDILQANIIVHVAGRVTPEEFGGEYGPYAETIFLWHSLNHYNLLVHKWHGLPDSFEHMDASGAWHGAAKRAKLENRSKLHA